MATHELAGLQLPASQRRLLAQGCTVKLGVRAYDLLVALVEGRDRVLTKAELLNRVWPAQAVEEANLAVQVSSRFTSTTRRSGPERSRISALPLAIFAGSRSLPAALVASQRNKSCCTRFHEELGHRHVQRDMRLLDRRPSSTPVD